MRLREAMPSLDGATTILNGTEGSELLINNRPTFIHFWAVSCHLCKKAMPNINKLRDQYKDDLRVISVYMPRLESDYDLELVKQVAVEHGISQPILVDNEHVITNRFQNKYVPAYYLFDKAGQLRHFQAGGSSLQMIEKRIERILKESIGKEV